MTLGPVTLIGSTVRLEPLRPHHADGLEAAATSLPTWRLMSLDLTHRPTLESWVQKALAQEENGTGFVFAVVRLSDERLLGATMYLDIRPSDRGVEIGSTWYARDVWGTRVNPDAKRLLLSHAFESWGAIRVQLKTDHLNEHSQRAIRKLGARYEGTIRNHRMRRDGTIRHTVMFSITDAEWPTVKASLDRRLA